MNVAMIAELLAQLEAGSIAWEQALVAVTALPTAWLTKEWKEQREKLIGKECAVCFTNEGPFVLQHLTHCDSFKQICQTVKGELRVGLSSSVAASVTVDDVVAHVGEGIARLACPTCGSISVRERKNHPLPYVCQKVRCLKPYFELPVSVRYYQKQQTTDRDEALALARPFLESVAMVGELRKHDQVIQHEATLRSLRQSLDYRSLKNTATYCKKCAFKEDLPIIKRKQYV